MGPIHMRKEWSRAIGGVTTQAECDKPHYPIMISII